MFFIVFLAALVIAAAFIKIAFFVIKLAFKLLFVLLAIPVFLVCLPGLILLLLPVGGCFLYAFGTFGFNGSAVSIAGSCYFSCPAIFIN